MVAQFAKFKIAKENWKQVLDEIQGWKKSHAHTTVGLKDLILIRNHISGHAEVLALFEHADALDKFASDQVVLQVLKKVMELSGADGEMFEVEVY